MFAFNPAGADDFRQTGIDRADLARVVLRLSAEYLTVLVEQDRDY